MENFCVVLLLVVSAICAAQEEGDGQCSNIDICSPSIVSSCSVTNCSCATNTAIYYDENGEAGTCNAVYKMATYGVEFITSNDNCSDYFNKTNIPNWMFRGISHKPSCNIIGECCNNTSIQDCFTSGGLNETGMLNVSSDYPYTSVIAEFQSNNEALTIGVSLLQLCNDTQWLPNVMACGEYFNSTNGTGDSSNCFQCDNDYNFGCFDFTLVSLSDPTSQPPPSTIPTASSESIATTVMSTGTSAGSIVTHSFGTMLFLLAVFQLFHAAFP